MLAKSEITSAYSVLMKPSLNYQNVQYLYVIGSTNLLDTNFMQYILKNNDILIGANINEKSVETYIERDLYEATIKNVLKANSTILTRFDLQTKLDDYIIVYKDFNSINELGFSIDEIIQNMLIKNVTPSQIDKFCENGKQFEGKYELNDIDVNKLSHL